MDEYDTLAQAKAALKKAAASQLARKERLEEELQRLRRALALQPDDTLAEAVAEKESLLATVEHDLQESLQELRSFDGLKDDLRRATLQREVGRLTTEDPFAPSAEARALENVRGHIETLDAQAEVMAELGAEAKASEDARRKLARMDAESREAAAKAQLAALKAARQKAPAPGADPAADPEAPPAPPTKPKRTL
jgi:hypothetical protein